MDYAALQAKNPNWTRQPDRAELMAEQKQGVETHQRREAMRLKQQNQQLKQNPAELMARQEALEWERMQVAQDLMELLEKLHHDGHMPLERLKQSEQVPTS